MKPLFRWVIGPAKHEGFEVLKYSISRMRTIYKDRFDYLVCYNNLDADQIRKVNTFGVDVYAQSINDKGRLPIPVGPAWKVYPPRMRLDSHEIVLDNDVIIDRPLDEIEEFLSSDDLFLVTEALKRSFGNYDHMIKEDVQLNTGLYGLPPNFDLESELVKVIKDSGLSKPWSHHLDKQGAMASIIVKKRYKVITRRQLDISLYRLVIGSHGNHFVGVNSGNTQPWKQFLAIKRKLI